MRGHSVCARMSGSHAPVCCAGCLGRSNCRWSRNTTPGKASPPLLKAGFENPDGTFSILLGYYNRNLKQDLDIPIGPDNRIEPGRSRPGPADSLSSRPAVGHVHRHRAQGFRTKKLTWTLTANGSTTAVPGSLNPLWELSPFVDATGNTPPFVGFAETGPFVQGPRGQSTSLTTTLPESAVAHALGRGRRQRHSGRDAPEPLPAGHRYVEQVPRTRLGDFLQSKIAVEKADFRAFRHHVHG